MNYLWLHQQIVGLIHALGDSKSLTILIKENNWSWANVLGCFSLVCNVGVDLLMDVRGCQMYTLPGVPLGLGFCMADNYHSCLFSNLMRTDDINLDDQKWSDIE